jgi:hypothetical protein
MKIFPEMILGGVKFKAINGVEKCNRCDEYGHITVLSFKLSRQTGAWKLHAILQL